MRKILLTAALAASALTSGCASTGPMNGFSLDAMASVVVWRNPDTGNITDADWAIAVRHANWCKHNVTDKQLSGPLESAATMATVGGIAGAAGVGGGAKLAGVGALGPMAVYGGVAGAANGVEVGLIENSNTRSAVTGTCTGTNLSDPETYGDHPGLHATAAYVRTTNHSNKVPTWVVPTTGTPATTGQSSSTSSTARRTLPPPAPMPMHP